MKPNSLLLNALQSKLPSARNGFDLQRIGKRLASGMSLASRESVEQNAVVQYAQTPWGFS